MPDNWTMHAPMVINALGDNLIYVLEYGHGRAIVVDPGQAKDVLGAIEQRGLRLSHILCTHHHWDHTGGVGDIAEATGCDVVALGKKRQSNVHVTVEDGQVIPLGGIEITAIATPGHTADSVCYYVSAKGQPDRSIVFTGDTLFIGGCGRIFECDAEVMYDSLQKLVVLPGKTQVYCGHEYTIENYQFALQIEPENTAMRDRLRQVKQQIGQTGCSVPSTIEKEKETNCFLRANSQSIRDALQMSDAPAARVFSELRRRKDAF